MEAFAITVLSRSKKAPARTEAIFHNPPCVDRAPVLVWLTPHLKASLPSKSRSGFTRSDAEVSMFTTCWSVKGGSGTTVVAASLAIALAQARRRVVLADLAGDVPTTLGVADPAGPGLFEWLAAGATVPEDALGRLATSVSEDVELIGRGAVTVDAARCDEIAGSRLVGALRMHAGDAELVVDCGRAEFPAAATLVAESDRSLLVLRPCYLALRRAMVAPRPSGVILVCEPDRALSAADVEDVLGVRVVAEIPWDPTVARAVDAGLLVTRLPRRLLHAIREVAA